MLGMQGTTIAALLCPHHHGEFLQSVCAWAGSSCRPVLGQWRLWGMIIPHEGRGRQDRTGLDWGIPHKKE